MAQHQTIFKRSALYLALTSSFTVSNFVVAQQNEMQGIERIEVTGSRRSSSVQEAPLNITALDADIMADQNITQLSDIARWVPGLTIPDQGGYYSSPIIVRGLNTNASNPGSDGGTVATYVGEIPLDIDMKILDVERVEVLIGPQGTLYGAGTLGGAIRYLPKKPILDETSGSIYGDVFSVKESSDTGGEAGFVFNQPLVNDKLGLRVAFNYLDDPGYIDYNYLLKTPGVSLADPDWNDPVAVTENLTSKQDINHQKTTTARATLRWQVNNHVDANLAYLYQKDKFGGRGITHYQSLSDDNPLAEQIGKYDGAYRYLEPKESESSLLSLEVVADLGFAELTSATGKSSAESSYQRDQTDLLIRLDYSYEEFPAFSAFTRDTDEADSFTQEIRLVSKDQSSFSWIVGGYYNNFKFSELAKEFTPGFSQFAVDNFGGEQIRPDELEYIAPTRSETTEKALFGELNFEFTEQLNITLGARFYEYKSSYAADSDLPLYNTLYEGAGPTDIDLTLEDIKVEDDGNLFKLNVSYQYTPDVLSYFTISEGFRLGGSNGTPACPDNIDEIERQIICALPYEYAYTPDTTTNYEAGLKSSWLKNKFHFNAALYFVEWDDAQVSSSTENGQSPITLNAAKAESKGLEVSTRAAIHDNIMAYATYAYTKAKLSEDAVLLGALAGDRLPGTAEHQFSFGLNYNTELYDDYLLDVNYGLTYQSDVYTSVGLSDSGEKLPSYALSNLSAKITKDEWTALLYIDNLFDKYAYTSVRQNKSIITDATNGYDMQRYYGHYIETPRTIGVRISYDFDL